MDSSIPSTCPVNLNPYRRPCDEGPRVVPIRAILSWNDVPDCGNPNWVPTWGNREETLILIPPGTAGHAATTRSCTTSAVRPCAPSIRRTGLAVGGRPFGGTLCITGEIPGALSLAVPDTLEYKVWATQGATTIPLVAPFSVTVEEGTARGRRSATRSPKRESATAISSIASTARRRSAHGGGSRARTGSSPTGTRWASAAPGRFTSRRASWGRWRRSTRQGSHSAWPTGPRDQSVNVTLDQDARVASIAITGYTDATGPHPALPCGDFPKGVTINGTFDITDNMGVGTYSLVAEPSGSVVDMVDPGSTSTHVFGTWTVATNSLDPCGYVVRLTAYDVAIVNCGTSWRDDATVGFCLRNLA